MDSSQAFKGLLDTDLVRQFQNEPHYIKILDVMEKLVNYSSNLFARCFKSIEKDDLAASIVLLNFRNMIELADAIHILARECSVSPASILLRSLFESLLNVEYILQDDEHYKARAMGYLLSQESMISK